MIPDFLIDRVVLGPHGCWLWTGNKDQGYGVIKIKGKRYRAHRWVYEKLVGPILAGSVVDHECHNEALADGQHRACVLPAHLTITSRARNVERGAASRTHCKRGHPLSGDNVRMSGNRRVCLACRHLLGRW